MSKYLEIINKCREEILVNDEYTSKKSRHRALYFLNQIKELDEYEMSKYISKITMIGEVDDDQDCQEMIIYFGSDIKRLFLLFSDVRYILCYRRSSTGENKFRGTWEEIFNILKTTTHEGFCNELYKNK
jgi:hypothetical protein